MLSAIRLISRRPLICPRRSDSPQIARHRSFIRIWPRCYCNVCHPVIHREAMRVSGRKLFYSLELTCLNGLLVSQGTIVLSIVSGLLPIPASGTVVDVESVRIVFQIRTFSSSGRYFGVTRQHGFAQSPRSKEHDQNGDDGKVGSGHRTEVRVADHVHFGSSAFCS